MTKHIPSLILLFVVAGCASLDPNPPQGIETSDVDRTVELDFPRDMFPGPGLCRVVPTEVEGGVGMVRSCDGIEYSAPLGSIVLYRPRDAREIHVRYMHITERGRVYRTDIFDMDTRMLIREIN
jgi:hypothetical protein